MLLVSNSNLPYLNLLEKCKTLDDINQIHSRLIKTGFIKNPILTTKIVLVFASSKHQSLAEYARRVFLHYHAGNFRLKDPFLWNAVIKSYSHGCGDPRQALIIFCLMLEKGVWVDKFTMSLVMKACCRAGLVREGMQIHGFLRKMGNGLGSDLFLENCLVGFYLRCGCLRFARQMFDRMSKRDSVSYNSMIDGYVKRGLVENARKLFDSMPVEERNLISWNSMISGYMQLDDGFKVACELFDEMPERDLISWNSMIDGCVKHGRMEEARALFDAMLERDVVSWASMIDGYAKVGQVQVAKSLFDEMPGRDVVACNSMMAGYVQNGYYMEALEIFHAMEREHKLSPDETTLLIVLSAIARLGHITKGMAIHLYMVENKFDLGGKLGVGLIDMYSKCGSIKNALWVFRGIENRDIDHWNAMIGGLAIHGLGESAFILLMELERLSVEPDDITFIGVLNACGHSGLVKEGLISFELMRRTHKIEPKLQHYGCMVDILARSGSIGLAIRFIEEMPIKPNDVIWRTLLSACNNYNFFHTGELVAMGLIQQDCYNSSPYVLLSNMYAGLGMWKEVRRIRTLMKRRNLKKVPGYSWIELEGVNHEFFVQDKSHPQATEIYSLLHSF